MLLLDNCEHVLVAASVVAATVAAAAKASLVLATSREPLDVEGEVLWSPRAARAAHSPQRSGSRPCGCRWNCAGWGLAGKGRR